MQHLQASVCLHAAELSHLHSLQSHADCFCFCFSAHLHSPGGQAQDVFCSAHLHSPGGHLHAVFCSAHLHSPGGHLHFSLDSQELAHVHWEVPQHGFEALEEEQQSVEVDGLDSLEQQDIIF